MTPAKKNTSDDRPAASVASPAENAALEHSRGGATTRNTLDAGVPMKQGEPGSTFEGPEDAMGFEETRGDYSGRIDGGPHLISVPIPESERGTRYFDADGKELTGKDAADKAAFSEPGPNAKLVEQGPASPSSPGVDVPDEVKPGS